jgi:uncharacterized membrane protein
VNSNTKRLIWIGTALGVSAAAVYAIYTQNRPRYAGLKFKKSIIVDRSASDLYAFWRNFENLPRISDMLESVTVLDDERSRWTISAPGNLLVRWDAQITKDIPGEMIGWQSMENSAIETAGYVRFEPTLSGRGTLVRVALEYNVPAGKIGAAIAAIFGKRPAAHVEEMLRRFKRAMEADETATHGWFQERYGS